MRQTFMDKPRDIRVENAPDPKIISPTDAIIRIVGDGAVGLCGVIAPRELGAARIIAMDERRAIKSLLWP